jgi:hypothetical protein
LPGAESRPAQRDEWSPAAPHNLRLDTTEGKDPGEGIELASGSTGRLYQ